MHITNFRKIIKRNLEFHINRLIPHHKFADAYKYAVIPPGKLFRPLLTKAMELDIKKFGSSLPHSPINLLSTFVEIHHDYTLAHDDLPIMDDDDLRRGRASLHKAYNEWQALLVGDGLVIGSFRLLSKINHPQVVNLLNFVTWATGPKGLIQGQYLDLSGEMRSGFHNLVETHKLKTSRLIQVCLVGSYILCADKLEASDWKRYHRLGENLGIAFQFLDDLSELADKELSSHEKLINSFMNYPQESYTELTSRLEKINDVIKLPGHTNLREVVEEYFLIMKMILEQNIETVKHHLPEELDLSPVLGLLDTMDMSN